MATAAVTAALLLGALGRTEGRDYFPKTPQRAHPFEPHDFPRFALSGLRKGGPPPERDPGAVFFIPVKFDLGGGPESRGPAADPPYDADSPRLVMDKDFNIRFDNPYIVPLTKPLALVLDGRAAARARDGAPAERMMIPFPVLVKARRPLLDGEGFRDYRDDEDVAEHRTDTDDAPEPPAKPPRRDAPKRKNGTAARTGHAKSVTLHSLEDERPRGGAGYKPAFELDTYNGSVDSSDLYPGKIFADMYRNMPAFDSDESREAEPPRYAGPGAKPSRTPPEAASPPWRPRASDFPGRERLFSAASDLEWVTHANSSKARAPGARDARESRIVIRDADREDASAPGPDTTTAPEEVTISRKFWRTV